MAKTLVEVLAAVTAQRTVVDSVLVLVQGLHDQISALPNMTPEMQAQIDEVFAGVEANTTVLGSALVANVPPPV